MTTPSTPGSTTTPSIPSVESIIATTEDISTDFVASVSSSQENFKYEKGVCALSWWEPIKLLEEGSISDIHLVRRRDKFVKVRYKEKRDVMELAKKQLLPSLNLFRRQRSSSVSSQQQQQHNDDDDNDEGEQFRVLKSIHKDHIGDESVLNEMRREILVMSQLKHPHIVQLMEAYERRRHIYLVMEYLPGGNLTNHIYAEHPEAKRLLGDLLSALKYLHAHGVAHRDIKLENIMLTSDGNIKLIDFGLATKYLSHDFSNMTDTVGTLYSMAPEVLQGQGYDEQCDLWSVGVVAYMILSGVRPFWGELRPMAWKKRRKLMIQLIKRGEYAPMTDENFWGGITEQAKDFVKSLLRVDPRERPTAQEAWESKWIQSGILQKEITFQDEGDDDDDQFNNRRRVGTAAAAASRHDSVRSGHGLTEFRRSAWRLLTNNLTEQDLERLEGRLQELDIHGTGIIDVKDFVHVLQELSSLSEQYIDALVKEMEEKLDVHQDDTDDKEEDVPVASNKRGIQYIDFLIEIHMGRERLMMDALASTMDRLDTTGTRTVVVKDALGELAKPELRLSQELQEELRTKILSLQDESNSNSNNNEKGTVPTVPILEWFGKRIRQRQRDSVRSIST